MGWKLLSKKFSKIVHKLLLRMITVDFWNQKFENSREYCNFENNAPQTPTWHQILKRIRMLVTIFISYTSIYIHVLNTHKSWCPSPPKSRFSLKYRLIIGNFYDFLGVSICVFLYLIPWKAFQYRLKLCL